jgi:hypothetical protein
MLCVGVVGARWMRPRRRLMAARREESAGAVQGHQFACHFNEAAASCRGKRLGVLMDGLQVVLASMRPRHLAAENTLRSVCRRCRRTCFNEAAASHRGKLQMHRLFALIVDMLLALQGAGTLTLVIGQQPESGVWRVIERR